MALIYRAHFAFIKAPRVTTSGINTSAVFGFTNTLLEVLNKEKPTHLGVAFDTPAPTFRHVQFEAYKAQREAQPEDISVAIPYVKKLVEAMNIPLLMLDGYEADDVIGTVAKQAAREGFEVYMMTPDKDYGQLVEEHIYMYKPAFMGNSVEKLGIPQILDRWKIERIEQVVDILGLMGDAVDNIPGVPGVGEKTAQKLVAEYGSIENIIATAAQIKGKLGEKIQEFADQALLCKHLATIETQVPVAFDAKALEVVPPDAAKIRALFDELEFKTLLQRVLGGEKTQPSKIAVLPSPTPAGQLDLFGGGGSSQAVAAQSTPAIENQPEEEMEESYASKRTLADTLHRYSLVDTPELRASLIYYLSAQALFCFDTETTSLEAQEAELVGLAFSYRATEAFYVPIPADPQEAYAVVLEFKELLENPTIQKVGQNMKYDLLVLKRYDIEVQGQLLDTMLAHYLLEPEKRHGMDRLANTYLHYDPVSIETLIGKKGAKQGSMRDVPVEQVVEYAGEDADITLQLYQVLYPKLQTFNAQTLFHEVEMPLVKVLVGMESEGVRVDTNVLSAMSSELGEELSALENRIYETAGETFNLNSPKQLGDILFEKLKLLKNPKKTKTGQYATGEDILSDLENEHEIVRDILDYRELQKLKSTYVDALPELINPRTGRIHTSYNQAVTATGRLSSTNPNLQNIPIRTPRGREIRKAFVARNDDYLIMAADYSQIELRIMAAFSGDSSMIEAFNQGRDIHATTAAKVFGVELMDVSSDMRRKAKMVNFGIIYGISAFGLAQRLGISRGEASEIIQSYFAEFPSVKDYMDRVVDEARQYEYVETLLGRRRYLPDINSRNQTNRGYAERNAINAPIQGSAADIIKVAMIRIADWMQAEKLRSRMILQVHDELVFDVHRDELDYLKPKVEELMRTAVTLSVQMETGIGIGHNWLEAH